jgi:hypothetical protein
MPLSPDDLAADAARTIALQMLQEQGRRAVLEGAARVDATLERLLQAVLLPAPGSTDPFFQTDRPLGTFHFHSHPHRTRPRRTPEAGLHSSPDQFTLAATGARILQQQVGGPGEPPVEAGLRDYILLITILVAYLEAAAQQLSLQPPPVVMGFAGIHPPLGA